MQNTLHYNVLFPSFVVYTDNNDIVDKKIIKISKQIISDNNDKPFYRSCISTVNTFGKVLELKEFANIRQAIVDTLGGYITRLKIKNSSLKFTASWLNLYNEHGYQDLHSHSDSMLSGVFYLKSDGNKDLVFQSPYHFFQPNVPDFTEINLENCSNVEYNSVVGRCFIFPSHLMHRTLPATSERISLSFNIVHDRS